MKSSTLSSDIESSPASSRSSSGRTGRLRAMIVALMKSVTALATSSGSSRERFPVDMMEFNILMRLLLCKPYEMAWRPGSSKAPGGYANEARQKQNPHNVHAGLRVGFDFLYHRPGALPGSPTPAVFSPPTRPHLHHHAPPPR